MPLSIVRLRPHKCERGRTIADGVVPRQPAPAQSSLEAYDKTLKDVPSDDEFFDRWLARCTSGIKVLVDTSAANAVDVLGAARHMSLVLLPERSDEVGLLGDRVCYVNW